MAFDLPHKEILNCMSEAVYVIDRNMTIHYSNLAAEELTGYTASEALGKKCSQIFCETSDRCADLCPPKTVLREKVPILHREAETKTKKGDVKQTQISFSPFYQGSECIGAVIVIKDITEVKKAEKQIQQQNDFLKLVINSLPHPFYVLDASNYTIKIANRASAPQGLADNTTCYYHTHNKTEACHEREHPCPLSEVKKTHKPVVLEHIHYDAHGQPRFYEIHGYPILDEHNNVRQMIEYTFDITNRKIAEQELQLHGKIVANMAEAVFLIRANDGVIVYTNPKVDEMFGYSQGELIGENISKLDATTENNSKENIFEKNSHLKQKGIWSGDIINVRKNGTFFWCHDIVSTFEHHAHGKLLISIRQDITERKKAEEERLKSHMLESIGFLAGGIAHDFNNLLTVILSNIDIAKSTLQDNDKAVNRLVHAEEICGVAAALSRRLLIFATGGDPIKKIMPLTELIRGTVYTLLKNSDIAIQFLMQDGLYPAAIDEGQLKQIIQNLIANAKEAMPNGGTLVVQGENLDISAQDKLPLQSGKYLRISIRDTGTGIASDNLAKVFDPYYSTKDTYSQKGLGLGLAVCYSIMKKHDGLITVESDIGKGTAFHLFFPAAEG
jgi:PAS domain S-box-containing protein